MGTITFQTITPIDLEEASQEKKVLVRQIADSAASPRPFHREMRFLREMPKDLYHLYQMNKLDCISEVYTGTGHLSICTKPVPTCTTYTQGKASSELVKAAIYKAKGHSRSQSPFFLAGPQGLIFSSAKVTVSGGAEVTVSMTSEDSAGYGKCDSGSHLSSLESGSAKYRQRRSAKVGAFQDNLLNIKEKSDFVQAEDIAQTLCVTISNSQNQQRLGSLRPRHIQKNDFRTLEDVQVTGEKKGSIRSATLRHYEEVGQLWNSCLALLRNRRLISVCIEVTMNCPVLSLGSLTSSIASITSCGTRDANCVDLLLLRPVAITSLRCFRWLALYSKKSRKKILKWSPPCDKVVSTLIYSGLKMSMSRGATNTGGTFNQTVIGVNDMACSHDTQTRPKFTDTYWIVPCYETTPYGKVSFTRQDRRTFIAMFKDSRLIWAGRQPVKYLTENVICTQLQVGMKGTMSHEGIEEISIPQGMVKITTPLTIEEISTVPTTVSDIATVQEVAHG